VVPPEILKKSDEATLAVAVRSNVFCGFDDALLQVARDPSDSAFFLARRQRLAALIIGTTLKSAGSGWS